MRHRFARLGLGLLLTVTGAFGMFVSEATAQDRARAEVVRLDLDGVVQPLSAAYIADGIKRASDADADAVLLRIDTPGGLDGSMRKIVGALLDAPVPVICWVGPGGARAASAGTFILLACNVATMAPGTNVGAAHPVGLRGEVLADKITNDAAAFIRAIAQDRGRDAAWAERAVRESVSVSATEARRIGVIDAVTDDAAAALRFADGREVTVGSRELTLDVWPADIDEESIAFGRGLLGSLIDPNLAYLLFIIGLAGLIFEVLHPGLSIPGVFGLLSLLLAMVMFEMLPVNLAGVLMLLAGVVFLVVELHVPGFGLPGIAGVVSLVLGGLLLFDAGTLVRVSRPLLAGTVIGMALFILLVLGKVVRARRLPPHVPPTLVGAEGVATSDLDPGGTVRVRSEEWTAQSTQPIKAGTRVLVIDEKGLTLRVDALDGAGGLDGSLERRL